VFSNPSPRLGDRKHNSLNINHIKSQTMGDPRYIVFHLATELKPTAEAKQLPDKSKGKLLILYACFVFENI
jgi:hypothetical protein